jgi:membrane glycosyltransferase
MRGEKQAYGGTRALILGTLFESGLSVLQAPVRMVAHTLFVVRGPDRPKA